MRDTIYRDEAVEAVEELNAISFYELNEHSKEAFTEIRRALKAIPSADRPQGDVDAVDIFEREMHNLEQGYITLGEFDERIEPLRHLCYGRPQGEWILDPNGMDWNLPAWRCSRCGFVANYIGVEVNGLGNNPMNWAGSKYCPNCGARMKGADDEH